MHCSAAASKASCFWATLSPKVRSDGSTASVPKPLSGSERRAPKPLLPLALLPGAQNVYNGVCWLLPILVHCSLGFQFLLPSGLLEPLRLHLNCCVALHRALANTRLVPLLHTKQHSLLHKPTSQCVLHPSVPCGAWSGGKHRPAKISVSHQHTFAATAAANQLATGEIM